MISLVWDEGGILPEIRIWLRWGWEFVQGGNQLSGSGPGGEGEFLFDNLTRVDLKEAESGRILTTCFLMGGEIRILDRCQRLDTRRYERGRGTNP